jgi:hypothetical protein
MCLLNVTTRKRFKTIDELAGLTGDRGLLELSECTPEPFPLQFVPIPPLETAIVPCL